MTLLDIPPLSTNIYHDGMPILPGDVAVPVLLVVDTNNKIAMVRGSPITVRDLQAPVLSDVSTAQAPSGYSFAPAEGTVADFTSGDVKVYHVLVLAGQAAMSAAQLAALVAASAPGDFGEVTLSPNVPGLQVLLSELGPLATSRVYAGAGPVFRAVREGDTVVSYVLAVDDSQLKSVAAAPPIAVDDRTPPSGLDKVTLGAPSATTIPVQNLDKITDGGDGVQSLSLFYGTSSDIASAAPVPDNPIPPTASYNIAGLDDATVYNVWVAATDGKNAAAPVALGSARTMDATDPVISAFDVAQGEGYTFTATAGTVVDNAAGPLMAYLVLCASPQTTEQLEAIDKAAVNTESKNEAVAYAANASASVSAMSLSTSQYWTGSAFASISESAPAAPHQLWAHLLVVDAAGNAGSSQNAGAIKTVSDRTEPAFTGTVALTAEQSSTSVKAAWSAAFADARGITEGRVYYSTTAPANPTASGVTAWKAAATTYYMDVSPLSSLGATGSATVTGLTMGTTYHVYMCVKDVAGNELNVATTPDSVTTVDESHLQYIPTSLNSSTKSYTTVAELSSSIGNTTQIIQNNTSFANKVNPIDGKLYTAYVKTTINNVFVMVVNMVTYEVENHILGGFGLRRNSTGERIGPTITLPTNLPITASANSISIDFDNDGTPYVMLIESGFYSSINRPVVYSLNTITGLWDTVGNQAVGSFTNQVCSACSLIIDKANNILYCSYVETNLRDSSGITVSRWRLGVSTEWEVVGTRGMGNVLVPGSANNFASAPLMNVDQVTGHVYVAFIRRDFLNLAHYGAVAKWTGLGDWQLITTGIGSAHNAYNGCKMVIDTSGVYLMYIDSSFMGGKLGGYDVLNSENTQADVIKIDKTTGQYTHLGGRCYMPMGDPINGNHYKMKCFSSISILLSNGLEITPEGHIIANIKCGEISDSRRATIIYRYDVASDKWVNMLDFDSSVPMLVKSATAIPSNTVIAAGKIHLINRSYNNSIHIYTLANAPPRPKLPLPALPAFPLTEPFSLDNEWTKCTSIPSHLRKIGVPLNPINLFRFQDSKVNPFDGNIYFVHSHNKFAFVGVINPSIGYEVETMAIGGLSADKFNSERAPLFTVSDKFSQALVTSMDFDSSGNLYIVTYNSESNSTVSRYTLTTGLWSTVTSSSLILRISISNDVLYMVEEVQNNSISTYNISHLRLDIEGSQIEPIISNLAITNRPIFTSFNASNGKLFLGTGLTISNNYSTTMSMITESGVVNTISDYTNGTIFNITYVVENYFFYGHIFETDKKVIIFRIDNVTGIVISYPEITFQGSINLGYSSLIAYDGNPIFLHRISINNIPVIQIHNQNTNEWEAVLNTQSQQFDPRRIFISSNRLFSFEDDHLYGLFPDTLDAISVTRFMPSFGVTMQQVSPGVVVFGEPTTRLTFNDPNGPLLSLEYMQVKKWISSGQSWTCSHYFKPMNNQNIYELLSIGAIQNGVATGIYSKSEVGAMVLVGGSADAGRIGDGFTYDVTKSWTIGYYIAFVYDSTANTVTVYHQLADKSDRVYINTFSGLAPNIFSSISAEDLKKSGFGSYRANPLYVVNNLRIGHIEWRRSTLTRAQVESLWVSSAID